MASSFGTEFKIVNDVRQIMDIKFFGGGPWIHLATVKRGFKEYIAFVHQANNKVYIEEVERDKANFCLKKIEEDAEWADLYRFLLERGILLVNPEEIKLGR